MEIKVKVDGEFKVFKQDAINFKTMMLAIEWSDRMQEETKMLQELMTKAINEELGDEVDDYQSQFDPSEDLEFTAELICSFFEGHFTYDDFIHGAYFENVGDFYALGAEIFDVAFNQKSKAEDKLGKQKRKKRT